MATLQTPSVVKAQKERLNEPWSEIILLTAVSKVKNESCSLRYYLIHSSLMTSLKHLIVQAMKRPALSVKVICKLKRFLRCYMNKVSSIITVI